MNTNKPISEELKPVLKRLQAEGFKVYTYTCMSDREDSEINSLYWFENDRILNIQPNSWRHFMYARDRFDLGVSYIPSREHGSGCGLTQDKHDTGTQAADLLRYRKEYTWVNGIVNYKNMADFLKKESNILTFYKIATLTD